MADELVSQRAKWDRRHSDKPGVGEPALVLGQNLHLLPPSGDALDLACGLGANALALARAGLRVRAWDLSPVAIERLLGEAERRGLEVAAEVRDVLANPPEPNGFDVIVVAHFLERSLAPRLVDALRPRGLLFYQTFTRSAVGERGPGSPEYRLADNELKRIFAGLLLRVYREEGRVGDLNAGWRDLAMLVAEKPPVEAPAAGQDCPAAETALGSPGT